MSSEMEIDTTAEAVVNNVGEVKALEVILELEVEDELQNGVTNYHEPLVESEVAGGQNKNTKYRFEVEIEAPEARINAGKSKHGFCYYFCCYINNFMLLVSFCAVILMTFYTIQYHSLVTHKNRNMNDNDKKFPIGNVGTNKGYTTYFVITGIFGVIFTTTLCLNCCTKCWGMLEKKKEIK